MNVVRWDPFSDIDRFFNRMMPTGLSRWPQLTSDNGRSEWAPSADISETAKVFVIRASLPAVEKEDVNVVVDGILTVHIPKSEPQKSQPKHISVQ